MSSPEYRLPRLRKGLAFAVCTLAVSLAAAQTPTIRSVSVDPFNRQLTIFGTAFDASAEISLAGVGTLVMVSVASDGSSATVQLPSTITEGNYQLMINGQVADISASCDLSLRLRRPTEGGSTGSGGASPPAGGDACQMNASGGRGFNSNAQNGLRIARERSNWRASVPSPN